MFRWLKKKVKRSKKTKKSSNIDESQHVYEEISDDVFISHHVRTGSLPSTTRHKYPLFKPDDMVRDALYSIAQIPGIDLPRPPSTSSSRRKLSFEKENAPSKGWFSAPRTIGSISVFDDDSDDDDDEACYEYDLGSSSDVVDLKNFSPHSVRRNPSITRSETGCSYRKVKLVRDSSVRSSASKNSDASSGFFSEDTDMESRRGSSIRRKYRPQVTNRTNAHHTFVRKPSLNTGPKHHKVNEFATPSISNNRLPVRGHFRRPYLPIPQQNYESPGYLSPVKLIMPQPSSTPVSNRSEAKKYPVHRSNGHQTDLSSLRANKQRYGVADVFSAYEIPDFRGKTASLQSRETRANESQDDQPMFWKQNQNRLLQDVIRGNHERQMCIFV